MGKRAEPAWPSAVPPPARSASGGPVLHWRLRDVTELPRVRAELRRATSGRGAGRRVTADVRDRLVLALDEMTSNALRHGGSPVEASVRLTEDAYLVEVCDGAPSAPPRPAVGRDPSDGGLGLYLIAEMATEHGWYVRGDVKHVWALLPRW